jgi:hypothetical protein
VAGVTLVHQELEGGENPSTLFDNDEVCLRFPHISEDFVLAGDVPIYVIPRHEARNLSRPYEWRDPTTITPHQQCMTSRSSCFKTHDGLAGSLPVLNDVLKSDAFA